MDLESIRKDDDVMSMTKFIDACRYFAFIDYDGYGHPIINNTNMIDSDVIIKPSNIMDGSFDTSKYDRIVWYNR